MIAPLTDPWFEAEFFGRCEDNGRHYDQGANIEGAQGVEFWCPCGYGKPEYPLDGARPHRVMVPFANPRNAPPVPPNFGPTRRKQRPEEPDTRCRWQMSGDDFATLTLSPSVDVGCWHGFIERGIVR